MAYFLPYAILFSFFQVLTVLLVGAILFFTLKAYRITRQSFLINFFMGFTLLEVSFAFVLLNRLSGHTGIVYHSTLLVHEIIQIAAFAFIASTYYFRNRHLSKTGVATMAVVFIGVLAIILLIYFSFSPTIAFSWRTTISTYLYAISLAFLVYIIYHVVSPFVLAPPQKIDIFIPAGFGTLFVSQIFWVYWSLSDIGVALLFANLLYVFGLTLLAGAIAKIWRH